MEKYFSEDRAIAAYSGGSIEKVLETVAFRYIGANPRYNYAARPFVNGEIVRNGDYRYVADFDEIYPEVPFMSYIYAWGKYKSESDGELKFVLIPKGPVKIWMNGNIVYGTTAESERHDNAPITLNLPVKAGWNHLVLRFTKTKAGFGAEFGTWLGKLCYYFFTGLSGEPAGKYSSLPDFPVLTEGFNYTPPFIEPLDDISVERLALLCMPVTSWLTDELELGVFGRIFQFASAGNTALARTEIFLPVPSVCTFKGTQTGNCKFYAGKKLIQTFFGSGDFQFECKLNAGRTILSVISTCPTELPWDFSLDVSAAMPGKKKNTIVNFINPFYGGNFLPWVYAGPFNKTSAEELSGSGFIDENTVNPDRLVGGEGEKTYWCLDMPGAWMRLYNDNPLYGHWNYPLGVTLYGLIETARYFESADNESAGPVVKNERINSGKAIASYAQSHVAKSVSTLEYAMFDMENFGGATAVHHLMTSLDSLDDCGSFGSLVLEMAKDRDIGDYKSAVEITGKHIIEKQDRREEGCFWRRMMMHNFHNDTLWADDLYMSVPFLCRYSAYKKDAAILDLAVRQFEGFKKYLYMKDKKLMAHVYDFKRDMNTGIPWGRGNGWTIFSLTEILMVLPENHPGRKFLLDFFRNLAAGFLACQDENGMWRQVLNMPSSYIETSCTAMFICAFSRGIRFNWFDCDTAPYRTAAEKAWQALEKYSIDREGNIHGVCRGSEFSFNPKYYAEHLLPRLNDTHGIGIVLLAGVELLKMRI